MFMLMLMMGMNLIMGEDDAHVDVDDGDTLGDTLDDEDALDDGDELDDGHDKFFFISYEYCPAVSICSKCSLIECARAHTHTY
ncbi:hypothetical protein ACB092_02G163200 [Castanea dentata]